MADLKSSTPEKQETVMTNQIFNLPPEVYWEYIHTYHVWKTMIQRCHTVKSGKKYKNYRGRGIKVCDRWRDLNGFDNFISDMGVRPSPKHSIDRIDYDGNYEPSNCRWATSKEQARNRRSNRYLTVGGISATIVEWSEKTGIKKSTITQRLYKHGWSEEKAVLTPVRGSGKLNSKKTSRKVRGI